MHKKDIDYLFHEGVIKKKSSREILFKNKWSEWCPRVDSSPTALSEFRHFEIHDSRWRLSSFAQLFI